jgi:hypothetical protein
MIACLALEAQTGDRVKRRAENRANQRVDQKVDQAVDRAAQQIEGIFRRKKQEEPTDTSSTDSAKTATVETEADDEEEMEQDNNASILNSISFGGKFEPYENPVRMNVSMKYTMTNARGKETSSVMHYTLDTWQTGIEIESDDSHVRMLMENQEGSMTMITTEDDETSAFKMRQMVIDTDEIMPDASSYTVTELGNTRIINGYNCTEYLIETEEGTTNAWMTKEIDVDMMALTRAIASFSRQSKNKDVPNNFATAGFPIESTTVSKNGKETTVVQYYDINTGEDIDKSVFDMDGIEVMSIGF